MINMKQGRFEALNDTEYKRIEQRAKGYVIFKGHLFKLGITEPWLKCLSIAQGMEILKCIHSGFCGSHISTRSLAKKAIKQGVFWPTMIKDALEVCKTCEACQKNTNFVNTPSSMTQLITPTWPLQRWGIDLVGPLPAAQGNCRFTVVVVEYFTKSMEAKPLASISSATVKNSFGKISSADLGSLEKSPSITEKQFDSEAFKNFCESVGTKVKFASVYHPQSNGAVERSNGIIFSAIRKCLFNLKKGRWIDELPKVIWLHNTNESRATKFTLFRLLYGSQAFIPEEIFSKSLRVQEIEASQADEAVEKDLL